MIHQPAAHTDGDLMVFFRKSDVVAAGDVFVLNGYPVIDTARGGTLQGVIDALNRIIDITIPEFNTMGGTRVIPGHGRIANEIDVVEYRDMLTIIRDRVMTVAEEGGTLEQVKAAGVTLEYDGVYGLTSGPWTTDRFLEVAYKEMSALAAKNKLSSRAAPAGRGRTADVGAASRRPGTAATETAKPAATARRTSSEPFDGDWVLNTFKSQYIPSNTMPYRREMTLAFADEGFTHTTSTWRRAAGNDSPLARTTYTAKTRRQGVSGRRLGGEGRLQARGRQHHRAHGSRRSQRHRDRDLDALLRSQGADNRHQGQGRRRDRLQQHPGLRSPLSFVVSGFSRTDRRSVRL